jgi:hypothetical protein
VLPSAARLCTWQRRSRIARRDPEFSPGTLRRLFSNQASAISQIYRGYAYDGSQDRFLMVRNLRREEVPAQLILAQNFIEDVKARVGH